MKDTHGQNSQKCHSMTFSTSNMSQLFFLLQSVKFMRNVYSQRIFRVFYVKTISTCCCCSSVLIMFLFLIMQMYPEICQWADALYKHEHTKTQMHPSSCSPVIFHSQKVLFSSLFLYTVWAQKLHTFQTLHPLRINFAKIK